MCGETVKSGKYGIDILPRFSHFERWGRIRDWIDVDGAISRARRRRFARLSGLRAEGSLVTFVWTAGGICVSNTALYCGPKYRLAIVASLSSKTSL